MTLAEEVGTMVFAFDDAGRKESVRRIARRVAQLEAFAREYAEEPCHYGDNCPDFGRRHGRCLRCMARLALGDA